MRCRAFCPKLVRVITPNRLGALTAVVYLAGAILVVLNDRMHPGFIRNIGTFLITAPVSVPLSALGLEPDLRSLAIVGALVMANAGLFYLAARALARLFLPSGG